MVCILLDLSRPHAAYAELDAGIEEFCTVNHGVTFPLMKKSDVNGDNTNEVFKWLKNEKSGLLGLTRIKVSHCQPVYLVPT